MCPRRCMYRPSWTCRAPGKSHISASLVLFAEPHWQKQKRSSFKLGAWKNGLVWIVPAMDVQIGLQFGFSLFNLVCWVCGFKACDSGSRHIRAPMPGEACYLSVSATHPEMGPFFTANLKGRRSSSALHSDEAGLTSLIR